MKHHNEWKWEREHEDTFGTIKEAINQLIESKRSRQDLLLLVNCYASKEGLGAFLVQKQERGWETTQYASRILADLEQKYPINDQSH